MPSGFDGHLVAADLGAQRGQLAEREAHVDAAADVVDLPVPALGVVELALDEVDEVVDMKEVADLLARAAEADVAQRPAQPVPEQPEGEDALVDLAHLPGAGDHSTAVDHRLDAVAAVLGDELLGGELGRAV